MIRSTLIRLAIMIVLVAFTACSAMNPQPTQQNPRGFDEPSSPNFWDEISVSPSTTMPGQIADGYWFGQFQRVNRAVSAAQQTQIVFFGDSITWNWSLGGQTGKEVWERNYAELNPINMGNSGDITPVMLYRVQHGNLNFPIDQQPKVAVLLCGTNNFVVKQSDGGKVKWDLGIDCPPEDVAEGARAIAQMFRRRCPNTRVIVLGILPIANQTKWQKVQQVNAISQSLTYNADEVVYVDMQDTFLKPDGSLDASLYTDGTHLTAKGYEAWSARLDPLITKMLKAPALDSVKIMLVGDSVTQGASSSTAFRRYLDGMLRRQGHAIDFIGSQKNHLDGKVDPDSYAFDVDHEAYWGISTGQLANKLTKAVQVDTPDFVVIHAGTDQVASSHGSAKELTADIVGNLDRMIDTLRQKNENVKVLISTLSPIPDRELQVRAVNNAIKQYAKSHTNVKSLVMAVDLRHGFDRSQLDEDGIQPSAYGASRLARIFAELILEQLNDSIDR